MIVIWFFAELKSLGDALEYVWRLGFANFTEERNNEEDVDDMILVINDRESVGDSSIGIQKVTKVICYKKLLQYAIYYVYNLAIFLH